MASLFGCVMSLVPAPFPFSEGSEHLYRRRKMIRAGNLLVGISLITRRALPLTCPLSLLSPGSPLQFSDRFYSLQVPDSSCRTTPDFSWKRFYSECAERCCWNCGSVGSGTAPLLLCESCRSIQPVDSSIDYFKLFGLPHKYDIEVGTLEGKYKDLQKKLHPDLVHAKSETERHYAADQSARVNDAYRTLLKPLSRAIYVMRLEGVDVNEEETVSDTKLLMEIMEVREAVEEAPDKQVLHNIQSQMQEKLEHLSEAFLSAFQNRKFDKALDCIRRMTYYQRVCEEIVKKL